jgi:hypothetical protein
MYEQKKHPPLSMKRFLNRMLLHAAVALTLLFLSLIIGMAGYEHYEQLPWRNAFLNAAMLLGGMGPVDAPVTDGGKLFAGVYALYAGLVFIIVAGLILAPIIHRIMHKFHWSNDGESS